MSPSTSASGIEQQAVLLLAQLAQPAGERALRRLALGRRRRSRILEVAAAADDRLERRRAERLGELLAVVDHDHERPAASRAQLDSCESSSRRVSHASAPCATALQHVELGQRRAARREQAELRRLRRRARSELDERRERGRAAAAVRARRRGSAGPASSTVTGCELGVADAERRP